MKRLKAVRWRLYDLRDLGPERLRGATICRVRGHRYSVPKMYDLLCSRCRASTPRRYPLSYTDPATGKVLCVECNISLSSERFHARGCTLRYVL